MQQRVWMGVSNHSFIKALLFMFISFGKKKQFNLILNTKKDFTVFLRVAVTHSSVLIEYLQCMQMPRKRVTLKWEFFKK